MARMRMGPSRRSYIAAAAAVALATLVAGQPPVRAQPGGQSLSRREREALFSRLDSEVAEMERHGRILKTVVRLVAPTVVHINTEKQDRFSQRYGRSISEAGSGVVIELDGKYYVLTNWHVVRDAALADITITRSDERKLEPQTVWHDAETDIAVMAVSGEDLVPARLGNSDQVEIGDFVLAAGSPFGLSHSVTYGIISAKGRRDLDLGDGDVKFQDFLQTDAAINPGNSGGPLINLRAEVIGINTAIASNHGGNEGVGFSIPVNMVMAVARQLVATGKVERAFLGVRLDPAFTLEKVAELGLTIPRGARVTAVLPNTPAAEADLKADDVVLRFDGILIEDDAHLINVVSLTQIGKEVSVVIFRDKKEMTLRVRVGDYNKHNAQSSAAPRAPQPGSDLSMHGVDAWDVAALGLTVLELSTLDAETAQRLRVPQDRPGLLVMRVGNAGPAAGKITRGEIIDRIDGQPIDRIDDLERVMSAANLSTGLTLGVVSGRSSRPRVVRLMPDATVLR